MKKTKSDIRKELEAGMMVFLSQGNQITKVEPKRARGTKAEPKEIIVEIEVDFLPKALRDKHFGE